LGLAVRKFAVQFVKDLFSDPRRLKKWLEAYFTPKRASFPWRSMIVSKKGEEALKQLMEGPSDSEGRGHRPRDVDADPRWKSEAPGGGGASSP
jgi:hypothetical protein